LAEAVTSLVHAACIFSLKGIGWASVLCTSGALYILGQDTDSPD
jgi:hypothetical protein